MVSTRRRASTETLNNLVSSLPERPGSPGGFPADKLMTLLPWRFLMPDIADGEFVEMQGSGRLPYVLKNVGGVYSCSCPAWRNQSVGIEKRSCKHIRKLRGDAAEETRIGSALPARPTPPVNLLRLPRHAFKSLVDLSDRPVD